MANAILIAFPASRGIGLVCGAIIIGAALVTVLRRREYLHVAPLSLFVALLVLVVVTG
jgi:Ni/Fe-hydrogenase subunit HybB-like protein